MLECVCVVGQWGWGVAKIRTQNCKVQKMAKASIVKDFTGQLQIQTVFSLSYREGMKYLLMESEAVI
jgi:hypothetical protein